MKEYEVTLEQKVTGTMVIKAKNKAEAKEVVEELVSNFKMQHLIQDVEELACDNWDVVSINDY